MKRPKLTREVFVSIKQNFFQYTIEERRMIIVYAMNYYDSTDYCRNCDNPVCFYAEWIQFQLTIKQKMRVMCPDALAELVYAMMIGERLCTKQIMDMMLENVKSQFSQLSSEELKQYGLNHKQ